MNINFDLKNLLTFFKRTSFRIAFLIGMFVYKFYLLKTTSKIMNNIINIVLIVAIIFVVDDVLEKIINPLKEKYTLKKYKKELKQLSEPQVLILIYHYFNYDKDIIKVNPSSHFNLYEGEYQILVSKSIIFSATSMSSPFNFPFTIQDWAYKEMIRAIDKKEIEIEATKKDYIIRWYSHEFKCNKNELNDMKQSLEDMSWL